MTYATTPITIATVPLMSTIFISTTPNVGYATQDSSQLSFLIMVF
jgi:hypothetical protein